MKWDSLCPRSSLWQRLGLKPSDDWSGYGVGRHVHHKVEANGLGIDQPEPPSSLSVVELRDSEKLYENAADMGLLGIHNDFIERTLYGRIGNKGVVEDWTEEEPTSGTYYSVTPDGFRSDMGVAMVDDWKTAQGLTSDNNLDNEPQAISYGSAVAQYLTVGKVVFTYWNLRFKVGQQIAKPADWFHKRAQALFAACVQRDKVPHEELGRDFRPGEHCGRCPYRTHCMAQEGAEVVGDMTYGTQDDELLYRRWQLLKHVTSMAKDDLMARLRERTSPLELEDGTTLGMNRVPGRTWSRKNVDKEVRGHLWQAIAAAALEEGADFSETFEPKRPKSGGLAAWLEALPPKAQGIAEEHLKHVDRQNLITLPKEK